MKEQKDITVKIIVSREYENIDYEIEDDIIENKKNEEQLSPKLQKYIHFTYQLEKLDNKIIKMNNDLANLNLKKTIINLKMDLLKLSSDYGETY